VHDTGRFDAKLAPANLNVGANELGNGVIFNLPVLVGDNAFRLSTQGAKHLRFQNTELILKNNEHMEWDTLLSILRHYFPVGRGCPVYHSQSSFLDGKRMVDRRDESRADNSSPKS
jgi:hypothetical protein